MPLLKKRKTRPLLLLMIGLFTVTEIVVLSPSPLEEARVSIGPANPENFISPVKGALAPGIPPNRIAEYAVDKFNYVSVQNGEKQWKIEATQAFMYNPDRLVHALHVKAFLFETDDAATVVTGKEAKYIFNQRDLEIFGDVHTVFSDGFELYSDYLRYLPNEKRIIIPRDYRVKGEGKQGDGQKMRFISQGMDYKMAKAEIILPEAVHMILTKEPPPSSTVPVVPLVLTKNPTPKDDPSKSQSPDPKKGQKNERKNERKNDPKNDWSLIESDHCLIYREQSLAHFTMYPNRRDSERFVHITQPGLFARSRKAELLYGSQSEAVDYLTALEDVLIKEIEKETPIPKAQLAIAKSIVPDSEALVPKPIPSKAVTPPAKSPTLRYGTGGRADFDNVDNKITLTEYPQVYQNNDTVTGDVIILHRDSDIIEVNHSNAFSEGVEDSQ